AWRLVEEERTGRKGARANNWLDQRPQRACDLAHGRNAPKQIPKAVDSARGTRRPERSEKVVDGFSGECVAPPFEAMHRDCRLQHPLLHQRLYAGARRNVSSVTSPREKKRTGRPEVPAPLLVYPIILPRRHTPLACRQWRALLVRMGMPPGRQT